MAHNATHIDGIFACVQLDLFAVCMELCDNWCFLIRSSCHQKNVLL
jgi:hypothetical protein